MDKQKKSCKNQTLFDFDLIEQYDVCIEYYSNN